MLSEADLALINALQIRPRASWPDLARALDSSPTAVARRWSRLSGRGDAWVTAYFSGHAMPAYCLAFVTAHCEPGAKERIAHTLVGDSRCLSIEITAGAGDLLLTIATRDLEQLRRYLLHRLECVPGLISTSTSLATRLYGEGAQWRLRALGVAAHTALGQEYEQPDARPEPIDQLDRRLVTLLSADGRASYTELAEGAGTSAATARRRIARMLRSRALSLRCEVAAPLVGFPVTLTVQGRIEPGRLDEVAAGIASLSEVRVCAGLTGKYNLLMTVWLRSISDAQRFEQSLGRDFPGFAVQESMLNLQTVKRMGRVLDQTGRACDAVSMIDW